MGVALAREDTMEKQLKRVVGSMLGTPGKRHARIVPATLARTKAGTSEIEAAAGRLESRAMRPGRMVPDEPTKPWI